MTVPTVDVRTRSASAVFTPVDTFVRLRGIDGDAAARRARGGLRFSVTAVGPAVASRQLAPGWTLHVLETASGHFLSDGILITPEGRRVRPVGGDVDVALVVEGPAYRRVRVPAVRLVNLEPSAPADAPVPVQVLLHPGYGYPFPDRPQRYSLLWGAVLRTPRGPGIADASVEASATRGQFPGSTYVTDASGQFVVVLPDDRAGPVSVTARTPNGETSSTTVGVPVSSTAAVPPFIFR
ncbi:Ig-like domain-containing protein [Geodermatophilus sp. SYSU D00742]